MVLSAICTVAPAMARAESVPLSESAEPELIDVGQQEGGDHGTEHGHYNNAFVLKIAHVETRTLVAPPGEAAEGGGDERGFDRRSALGITYERVLVPGWLLAEIGTLLSAEPGGDVAFPSTLLLKIPADVAEAIEAYFGAGVALEMEKHEGLWTPNWGAAAAFGAYVWIAPETGFTVDCEQSLLLSEGVLAEISLGAGVVTRF